jgi:hypothetical protein
MHCLRIGFDFLMLCATLGIAFCAPHWTMALVYFLIVAYSQR